MSDSPLVRVDGPRGGTGRHYARTDSGRLVPSVTTVVSLTPKPYLLNWVIKLASEWAAANHDYLTDFTYEERVDFIKGATRELREEGASKGTALHDYAEQYVWLGIVDPPVTRPEHAVVEIVDMLQPRILFTECMVWNGTVGYAGTLDGVWQVEWEGRVETWLIDWKTSKSRGHEWGLQQEAYRRAETIVDGRGAEWPMPAIDRMVILWCPYASDWTMLEVVQSDDLWEAFKAAHAFFRWSETSTVGETFQELGRKTATSTETGAAHE